MKTTIGVIIRSAAVVWLLATVAHAQTPTTYGYDALNRLGTAVCQDGTIITYTYGTVGNRTLKKVWRETTADNPPNWWEMQYFGNLNQTDTGDYDGDGETNLTELNNGTNPADATSTHTAANAYTNFSFVVYQGYDQPTNSPPVLATYGFELLCHAPTNKMFTAGTFTKPASKSQ